MKSANERDMTCDEDDHVHAPIALQTNKNSPSEDITVADDGHQHQF